MDKRKMIIDCDPGHDDAIAILLAAKSPVIDLLAITTVAGNQTLEKTTLNARRVCTVAGITNVPIAAGMAKPLFRKQLIADDIHGDTGLDGPRFGEAEVPVAPIHAVDLIINQLMNSDGDITLVPTGPLTNVATAMLREPRIIPKIKEVILMGGAVNEGNVTPSAEFNILVDAEAARIVFHSGAPITMVGLDLTHQAQATPDVIDAFRQVENKVGGLIVDLLTFFSKTYKEVYGFEGGPVHDACCVAKLIDPDVFTTRHMFVDVETKGELTYGRTVCDILGVTKQPPNVHVAWTLDSPRFWNLLLEAAKRYS